MKKFLIFILIFCSAILPAQDVADSLLKALTNYKSACPKPCLADTTKLILLSRLSEECELTQILGYAQPAVVLADVLIAQVADQKIKNRILNQKAMALSNIGFLYNNTGGWSKALNYHTQSLKISQDLLLNTNDKQQQYQFKKAVANSFNNIGLSYSNLGNIIKALEYYDQSLKLWQELNDKNGIALAYNNFAFIYNNQGNISKAIEYYEKALKIQEQAGNKMGIVLALNNIGAIYQLQGDINKALECYNQCMKIYEEKGDKRGMTISLINIGGIWLTKKEEAKGLSCLEKALSLSEQIGDNPATAMALNNIAFVYEKHGERDKALENHKKSLKLREEIGDKTGIANSLVNMAAIYFQQKKYELSKTACDTALAIAKSLGYPKNIAAAERMLSDVYKQKGNYAAAFEHYKQWVIYKDSINNESTRKASVKSQLKYEFEKKEAVIKEQQEKERQVAEEKSKFQQIVIASVVFGLLLVIVFAFFIARTLKQTRIQKLIIEEKQKEILDSIKYAHRIQSALMSNENYFENNINRLQSDRS